MNTKLSKKCGLSDLGILPDLLGAKSKMFARPDNQLVPLLILEVDFNVKANTYRATASFSAMPVSTFTRAIRVLGKTHSSY